MNIMTSEALSKEALSNNICTKIFLGVLITPDIRTLLNESVSWSNAKTMQAHGNASIKEIHHKDKDYIGIFLSEAPSTLEDIKIQSVGIMKELQGYCPYLSVDTLKIKLFPQIFLN